VSIGGNFYKDTELVGTNIKRLMFLQYYSNPAPELTRAESSHSIYTEEEMMRNTLSRRRVECVVRRRVALASGL
jgi:hypothetical protein